MLHHNKKNRYMLFLITKLANKFKKQRLGTKDVDSLTYQTCNFMAYWSHYYQSM